MPGSESPLKSNDGSEDRQTEETRQTAFLLSASDSPEVEAALPLPGLSRSPFRHVWGMAAVITCALLLATSIVITKWHKNELYLLWEPILDSKKTVFLYTGTVGPFYQRVGDPIDRTNSGSDRELPAAPPAPLSLSHVEAGALNASTFEPVEGELAPPGDISADLKIAALMNSYDRNLSLRSGQALQFADLKGSPTVLILSLIHI